MNSFWAKYGVSGIALVLIGVAFWAGMYVGEQQIDPVEQVEGLINKEQDPLTLIETTQAEVDFAPFWRVWNLLDRKFVPRGTSTEEIVDPQEKVWNAIAGLVATYDDPYTIFLRPEETEQFKESARGSFEGVGMIVGLNEDEQLSVVAPLENSPAEQAGLEPGDVIVAIDGEDSTEMTIEEGVERIRGQRGTSVALTVLRGGEEFVFSVTRGTIDIPSTDTQVVSREVEPASPSVASGDGTTPPSSGTGGAAPPSEPSQPVQQDFFVLRLFSFSQSSIDAFKRGLEEFDEANTDKLIIDLRGNPGGYLQAAVDIASWFLPEGAVVVREVYGPEHNERVHTTTGRVLFEDVDELDIVVLINGASASASEILAGALSEYGVATLIGEQSFGKGSVQELIDITGDIALKVTIARWYTPKGVSISEGGLTPDIVVDTSSSTPGVDPILERAIEHLIEE